VDTDFSSFKENRQLLPKYCLFQQNSRTKVVPYQPLTLDFFTQKWPFSREPAIFRIGDPFHSISYPQNPLGGTHFHGRHGHGLGAIHKKRSPKFPKKRETLDRFLNVDSSLKNYPRGLTLGLKFAGTCPLLVYIKVKWLRKLEIDIIALFLHMPNCHKFFTIIGQTQAVYA
jgi:hypothetical protein